MIQSISHEAVIAHYQANYRPEDLVITAAGGVDHEEFCALVQTCLEKAGWDFSQTAVPRPRRDGTPAAITPATGLTVLHRESEQAHVIIGFPSLHAMDERRYTLSVLNAILGGGMSSRLFQQIREERALAYAVYSFISSYSDAGYLGVYAGCAPAKVAEVMEVARQILSDIAEQGVTESELLRARGQIAGSSIMALEDPGARMSRLGRAELVAGEFLGSDEALRRIDAVSRDEIQALARALFAQDLTAVAVGPDLDEAILSPVVKGRVL